MIWTSLPVSDVLTWLSCLVSPPPFCRSSRPLAQTPLRPLGGSVSSSIYSHGPLCTFPIVSTGALWCTKRNKQKKNHKNCLVWDHESLDLLTAYAIKVIRSQGQQTPKNENTNETTRPTSIKQGSHCRKATERDICTPCAGGGGFDYFVSSVLARQKLQYIWNSKCRDVNWRLAENLFSFRVFALFFKQLSQMNLKRESEMSQNFVRQLTQLKYAQSNQGRCWRLTRMAKWPRSVRRKSGASSVHSLYIQQTWRRTSTR